MQPAMAVDMPGIVAIDRLKDHYKHCIRLSASNKINPKNAFDLQLIDYMQDLVSSGENGQMNFKIASSALDVGAKIYSNRVDCIQSEAQKVASSILMALDGQQNQANKNSDESRMDANTSAASDAMDDSREGDQDAPAKSNKRKRPTRSKNIKTVVEDENLLDAKLEKMVLGDPFLDGLSQDYDMSCPAALISYNALTQPNCLLTIESSHRRRDFREAEQPQPSSKADLPVIAEEPEDCSSPSQESKTSSIENHPSPEHTKQTTNHSSTNRSTDQYEFVTLAAKNINCAQIIRNNVTNHICPRLENFLFNDRTTTISGLDSNLDDSMNAPHENEPPLNSSRIMGGAHEFNPELYDNNNNNNDYDDHFDDAVSIAGENDGNEDRNENDLIPNLDKIAASKPTDYGYTKEHHRLLNTWAGPYAWRAAKVPQSAKKDAAPKSVRKRAKLEQKPIDFEEEFSPDVEELADKDIRVSSDQLKRWKKPLLPQDHNLTEDSIRNTLSHTFLRPEDTYHCKKTPADALKVVDKDHDYTNTDREAENDADEAPGSPVGMSGFDDVHDDSDDEFRADPMVEGNELAIYGAPINNTLAQQADMEFAGEHLIEQPYTVAQVNIPFAKIAKKMDVRKLKRVMWDLLFPPERRQLELTANGTVLQNEKTVDDETGVANGHSAMSADEQNQTVIEMNGVGGDSTTIVAQTKKTPSPVPSESPVNLQFSNLYGELPVRVSSKMASDLSQSIAFVTLLHLANEKNLRLIPKQDLKDFTIVGDSD